MNRPAASCDVSTIEQACELMFAKGQTVELRVLNAEKGGTISGYFDDFTRLVAAAKAWSGQAPAVYVTMNPVKPDCAARAYNRVQIRARTTTSDTDILRRTRLVVDIDSIRPTGVSATDEEHGHGLAMADTVAEWLVSQGWPEPMKCDSGNGAHLLYCIDLPNDAEATALVSNVLKALSTLFTNEVVSVDTACSNASRIIKLPGTMACKGDAIPNRPHRMSRILDEGHRGVLVTREQLQAIADRVKPDPQKPDGGGSPAATARLAGSRGHRGVGGGSAGFSEPFNIESALCATGWTWRGPSPWQGGQRWVLHQCPWNSDHTDNSAYVVQFPNGALDAGCHHNSCQGNGWPEMRDLLDPGWRDRRAERESARFEEPPHPADEYSAPGLTGGGAGSSGVASLPISTDDDENLATKATKASKGVPTLLSLLSQTQRNNTPPNTMEPEAYFGLPGEVVRTISPYTEACDAALLTTFLVCAGMVLGPGFFVPRDGRNHYPNEFACLVGTTSSGRKGTAWSRISNLFSNLYIYNNKYTISTTCNYLVEGRARGVLLRCVGDKSDKSRLRFDRDISDKSVQSVQSVRSDKSDKSRERFDQTGDEDDDDESTGNPDRQGGEEGPLFPQAEPRSFADLMLSGVGSGEGLIEALAEKGGDRRRLLIEEEFSRPLKVMSRDGSTLSEIIRAAWDGGTLSHRTRGRQIRAEGGHVAFLGHITGKELKKQFGDANIANGVGNRILWCCAHRSKSLPDGGAGLNVAPLVSRIQSVLNFQDGAGQVEFTPEARRLWADGGVYEALTARPDDPFGAVTTRAAAHVTRLALIYALLDCDREIKAEHLIAALAVWRYSEESAYYLFGDSLGDAGLDRILGALKDAYPDAMTGTQIRDRFARHPPDGGFREALLELARLGAVERRVVETRGRPSEYWLYNPSEDRVPGVVNALQLARDWMGEHGRDAA